MFFSLLSGADPENSERGGRVPHPPPPPPPPVWKLNFSGHAAYIIVGVFVMQNNVTLTVQNTLIIEEKKGARPLGPSSKSAYGCFAMRYS